MAGALADVVADLISLVLPLACVGCGSESASGQQGRGLCGECVQELAGPAIRRDPSPRPTGLPPCVSVSAYDGTVREAILSLKERGLWSLARPLGHALATSVLGCREQAGRDGAVGIALVPIPSSRAAIRARGDDPLALITARAARDLRGRGVVVDVLPVLTQGRRRLDQSGLDSRARMANLAGSMVASRHLRRLQDRVRRDWVCVLADDIVTTGATLVEAARALREVGVDPAACAVIAATGRRGG